MEENGLAGILAFFESLPRAQRQAGLAVHEFLISQTGVSCKIRYRMPFYDAHNWLCYIGSYKSVIELSFLEAKYFIDPSLALDWRDRKTVASIALPSLEDVPWEVVEQFVEQALAVDEEIANSGKKPSILWGKQRASSQP